MAQIGNRKMVGFFFTMTAMNFIAVAATVAGGVILTGDNVVQLVWANALVGGTFFGANMGEHFAKKPPAVK